MLARQEPLHGSWMLELEFIGQVMFFGFGPEFEGMIIRTVDLDDKAPCQASIQQAFLCEFGYCPCSWRTDLPMTEENFMAHPGAVDLLKALEAHTGCGSGNGAFGLMKSEAFWKEAEAKISKYCTSFLGLKSICARRSCSTRVTAARDILVQLEFAMNLTSFERLHEETQAWVLQPLRC